MARRLCDKEIEELSQYDWDHSQSAFDKVEQSLKPILLHHSSAICTESWVADRKIGKPTGLLILGDFGVGKSSALFVLLKLYRLEKVRRVLSLITELHEESEDNIVSTLQSQSWVKGIAPASIKTHSELVSELREGGITDLLRRRPLFIDDWKRAYSDKAGWNEALEYDLIDYRWRNKLPTFITTNMTPDEFKSDDRQTGANIDRVADASWLRAWSLTGESRRRRKV